MGDECSACGGPFGKHTWINAFIAGEFCSARCRDEFLLNPAPLHRPTRDHMQHIPDQPPPSPAVMPAVEDAADVTPFARFAADMLDWYAGADPDPATAPVDTEAPDWGMEMAYAVKRSAEDVVGILRTLSRPSEPLPPLTAEVFRERLRAREAARVYESLGPSAVSSAPGRTIAAFTRPVLYVDDPNGDDVA